MPPALSPETVEDRLRHWPVARLATLRDSGAAHLVPVVFHWEGSRLWIPVDGKPKRDRELERVRNIERDPRATLLVDAYGDDWAALWWIHLEGRATIRRDEASEDFGDAAEGLRRKYPQYQDVPLFRGVPTLIEITPERQTSWCARDGSSGGSEGANATDPPNGGQGRAETEDE
ncbi:MAG: TIGR03668 family PPOX class F420-dependent oxidoreductase [Actinobacteria bacterium]|nr:TIGR03668 family PPOX class F420-dependent oxidoreductase [Actinomycetota bacterium]NIS31082.1 TIGR03668 family PPOX class F420-dependent oxidoreductase [Actinomycetota bacterium]NIU19149.1 TIGR03668 family PPOX class F420-dependent oxidoreductase [Actinomycetota bacterium]NIU66243.1 TIGR03668 family PPOX class F420-dependent oxidoreductase [Actinomycetota bacterium]NIW28060.1 TIGR03668 family PPOX class F420-dependent oxidoreductase [Actinomycetota bacterium]